MRAAGIFKGRRIRQQSDHRPPARPFEGSPVHRHEDDAMLTLLKNLIPGPLRHDAGPTAAPPRMNLEERKAYRREMLYQSVRECMLRLEALASMYKFKVMSVDERHHRFIVMIEVTGAFEAQLGGTRLSHPQIEAYIRKRSYERHGVVIEGMYWRVDASQPTFTRARRAGDVPGTPLKPPSARQRQADPRLARQGYEPVSEHERRQFVQALQQGLQPPPLRVGNQEYASDLMPLETRGEVGGTQYGQL